MHPLLTPPITPVPSEDGNWHCCLVHSRVRLEGDNTPYLLQEYIPLPVESYPDSHFCVQLVPSARVVPQPAELAGKVGIVHGCIAFVHSKLIFVGDKTPS